MRTPEQRRKLGTAVIGLSVAGGLIATFAALGVGAERNTGSDRRDGATGTGANCTTVMYSQGDQLLTVGVPSDRAAEIQQRLDAGDLNALHDFTGCGQQGALYGVTPATEFAVSQQEYSPEKIREQLAAKQVGAQFEVIDQWQGDYIVEKQTSGQLKVVTILNPGSQVRIASPKKVPLWTVREVR